MGRGARKSYCVLVSERATGDSTAHDRLVTMRDCYDGFSIAERDLEMRGPGDFLRSTADASVRQSGGVRFRLAELCDDTGLLKKAFSEAKTLIESDPELSRYPVLAHRVAEMFTPEEGTMN